MRGVHHLNALNGDYACDLYQTSEREFKIVSAGHRVLQTMCPHTMWWVQAKGEEYLMMGAIEATARNVQPISFNYQKYNVKP